MKALDFGGITIKSKVQIPLNANNSLGPQSGLALVGFPIIKNKGGY